MRTIVDESWSVAPARPEDTGTPARAQGGAPRRVARPTRCRTRREEQNEKRKPELQENTETQAVNLERPAPARTPGRKPMMKATTSSESEKQRSRKRHAVRSTQADSPSS